MTDSTNTAPASPVIVVGVDGSEASRKALRWGAGLASRFGASIDAVAAWQVPPAADWDLGVSTWDPQHDAAQWLADAVAEAFGDAPPAGLRQLVRQGNAAQVLVELSKQALMLVVGSRGLGGFAGLLLGSVSAKCAEHAHCPVVVVHGNRTPDAPAEQGAPASAAAGEP